MGKLRGMEIVDAIERVFGPVMIVEWNGRKYSAPSTPLESPTPKPGPRTVPPTSYQQRRFDDADG